MDAGILEEEFGNIKSSLGGASPGEIHPRLDLLSRKFVDGIGNLGGVSSKEGDFEVDILMIDFVDWDEVEDALAEVFV